MKNKNNIATTSNPINVDEIVKCINNRYYTLAMYGGDAIRICYHYANKYYHPQKQTLREWVEANLNFTEFKEDFSFLDPSNPKNYCIVTYKTSPFTIQSYLVKKSEIEQIKDNLISKGYTDIKFKENFTFQEFSYYYNFNFIL